AVACSAALAGLGASPALPAASAAVADAAPNEILVKYAAVTLPRARVAAARGARAVDEVVVRSHTRLLRVAPRVNIASALERLRHRKDVVWAVRDYIAHASGSFIP